MGSAVLTDSGLGQLRSKMPEAMAEKIQQYYRWRPKRSLTTVEIEEIEIEQKRLEVQKMMEKNRKFLGRTTGSVQTIISALPTPARTAPMQGRGSTVQKSPRTSMPQRPSTPIRSPRPTAASKQFAAQQEERQPLQELPSCDSRPMHEAAAVDVEPAAPAASASLLAGDACPRSKPDTDVVTLESPHKMAVTASAAFIPGRRMAARAEQRLRRASSAGPKMEMPSTFSPRVRQAFARSLRSPESGGLSEDVKTIQIASVAPAMERVRVGRVSAPPTTEPAAPETEPAVEAVLQEVQVHPAKNAASEDVKSTTARRSPRNSMSATVQDVRNTRRSVTCLSERGRQLQRTLR